MTQPAVDNPIADIAYQLSEIVRQLSEISLGLLRHARYDVPTDDQLLAATAEAARHLAMVLPESGPIGSRHVPGTWDQHRDLYAQREDTWRSAAEQRAEDWAAGCGWCGRPQTEHDSEPVTVQSGETR